VAGEGAVKNLARRDRLTIRRAVDEAIEYLQLRLENVPKLSDLAAVSRAAVEHQKLACFLELRDRLFLKRGRR
jgi:hypothetical protein